MRTKNVFTYASILLLLSMIIAVSGCTDTPAAPTPTPAVAPTVTPTQEPSGPITIGTTKSNQVTFGKVNIDYARGRDRQAENFSVLLINNGDRPAKNTVLSMSIRDSQTDEYYFGDQFNVGEIPANSSRLVSFTTDSHDYSFSVQVNMDIYWGEDLEFKNSYSKTHSLAYVPWT